MKQKNCMLPLLLAAMLAGAGALRAGSQLANAVSGSSALTLDDAIRLALANNPSLQAAGSRVDAAAGRADHAKLWSNPELELNAEDWPVSDGGGFSQAKQTVGIAQTLPFPGKKSLDKRIGGAGVKLSESELALRRAQIVRDVKEMFFRALSCERLVAISGQLAAAAESSATIIRKRVEAGDATRQEELRAEVRLEQARTDVSGAARDLAVARQIFAGLLGRSDLQNIILTGALADQPDPELLDSKYEPPLAANPALAAAQANLDRARLESSRAQLEPYPDVKVTLAGGRIGATDESIVQLGFSVPLPIIDRGKGRQREAQANIRVAEAELHAAQQQLQREWAGALARYRLAAGQVANYRERILPKSAEALRLVQTGFEQGKFKFIDFVDTQRTTAEVQLTFEHKLLELNLARAELESFFSPPSSPSKNTSR